MTKLKIIFMLFQLLNLQAHAQSGSYFNHTELGPLIGKINQSDSRINFSLQTFNGLKFHSDHSLGFLIGVDTYPGFTLMPLALGWRGILQDENRISPYAGLDIGHASAWLEKRQIDDFMESWYKGGLMISPAVGIRRKSRNKRYAFSWSIGLKYQRASFYEGHRIPGISKDPNNSKLPPGFLSIREENYLLNSLYLKWGIVF